LAKSRKLRVSGPAKLDLDRIGEYTRREWGVPQKRKYLGQIRDKFKAVRDAPSIGVSRDDIDAGLRAVAVRSHVIFYRGTKTELTVVRVLHHGMDLDLHLKPRREGA